MLGLCLFIVMFKNIKILNLFVFFFLLSKFHSIFEYFPSILKKKIEENISCLLPYNQSSIYNSYNTHITQASYEPPYSPS